MNLLLTQQSVSEHLDRIAKHFKNPRITLLVRTPGNDEADFVMTSDAPDEAITALQRRFSAGETAPGEPGK